MRRQRSLYYKKKWKDIVAYYGGRCFYCRKEIATTIDHVVPQSWDNDDTLENLVPACALCNSIAGNKMFESVEHKRQYILKRRKNKGNRRAICVECLLPYGYRFQSPSLLLCALCYDEEYGTSWSTHKAWRNWEVELREAGIAVVAHQNAKKRLSAEYARDKEALTALIVDEYAYLLDIDEEFALFLAL